MKQKMLKKLCAGFLSAMMAVSMMPLAATAARPESTVYTGTAEVKSTDGRFEDYTISVDVTVLDKQIKTVAYSSSNTVPTESTKYADWAMNGYSRTSASYTGIGTQIVNKQGTEGVDVVSGATLSSQAIKSAVNSALEGVEITKVDTGDEEDNDPGIDYTGYVLMNIPYDVFYRTEGIRNEYDIDAFSSATCRKPADESVNGETYRKSDNSEITGITYPVKVNSESDLSALTKVATKTKLGTAASYSYCNIEPTDYYKELTIGEDGSLIFTKSTGEVTVYDATKEGSGFATELNTKETNSEYGDYELGLTGLLTTTDTSGEEIISEGVLPVDTGVYGVVLSTADNDYGMRAVENIWKHRIAWCSGVTTTVRGCTTSSQPYLSLMGQTITSITYYTTAGIYTVNCSVYVPVTYNYSVNVAEANINDGTTTFAIEGMPEDFDPEYTIEGLDCTIENGKITWDPSVNSAGLYTLKATDKNGVYDSMHGDFQLVSDIPVAYDEAAQTLVLADGATQEQFSNYISKITFVKVGDTDVQSPYESARWGAEVVRADGSINTDAVYNKAAVFADNVIYDMTITAEGYAAYSFSYDNRNASSISLTTKTVTYNGKAQAIDAAKVTGSEGKVTYNYYSDSALTKTVSAPKNAGTYYVTASVEGSENYKPAVSQAVKFVIKKASQTVSLTTKSVTYNGKTQSIGAAKVNGTNGKVTYSYYSNSALTKKVSAPKNAGTYYVTASVAGNENYNAAVSKAVKLVIKKASQTVKVKTTAKSYTVASVKKSKKSFSIGVTSTYGKLTVTKSSGSKYLTVSKAGKVTLKKGTKKGTYSMKLKITAASGTNYNAKTITSTIKVTVK